MGATELIEAQPSDDEGRSVGEERSSGKSYPLGATPAAKGVNFCVYSRNAKGMDLLLFEREDDAAPARVISLDPFANRSYHYWHAFVPGLQAGSFTGTACADHSIRRQAAALTAPRFCSIRMGGQLRYPKATPANGFKTE